MTNKKTIPPRQIALAVALGVAVAATLWAAQMDDDPASATPAVAARKPSARKASVVPSTEAALPASSWAPVHRAPWPQATRAQLAVWAPPPPPAPPRTNAKAEAPPPPVAPAFPYQLIGRLEEGGVTQALLAGPNRSINARAGDVIDGQWRVEKIGPAGLSLTWLPGQLPQTLNFRAS